MITLKCTSMKPLDILDKAQSKKISASVKALAIEQIVFRIESSRRGPFGPRPLTPPYVRNRIRRFMITMT